MIHCVFTIDYEVYGNGEGALSELVYEPMCRMAEIFHQAKKRCVVYVEVAELEMIEREGTDSAIDSVKSQIRSLFKAGHEIALHLHPQWYNAHWRNGEWLLDYKEYNLCTLPESRIVEIVDRGISYLCTVLGEPEFTPKSFRAGNWLLQPTSCVAGVLADRGIVMDSSVFKGGLQRRNGLDYRRALRNGHFWRFRENVNIACSEGRLLELPIYTQMVPLWKMITAKRVSLQKKARSNSRSAVERVQQWLDHLRFRYPLKFDFCRMTKSELICMLETLLREDRRSPESITPAISIGHTKDLNDFETLAWFLRFLDDNGVRVSTLQDVYPQCMRPRV